MNAESFAIPEYEIDLAPGIWSPTKRCINPDTVKRVFKECNYSCVVCGLCTTPEMPRDAHGRPIAFKCNEAGKLEPTGRRLTIDHIVPKRLRSTNRYPNLLVMCCFCNNKKADMLPRTWLKTLRVELQVSLLDKVIEAEMYHVLVSERDNAFHNL